MRGDLHEQHPTFQWLMRLGLVNTEAIHEPCELWERYLTELFRILGPLEFASLQPFVFSTPPPNGLAAVPAFIYELPPFLELDL